MDSSIGSSRVKPEEMALIQNWRDTLLGAKPGGAARLQVKKNGWGEVKANISYASTPLHIGAKEFEHGLA